VAKQTTSTPQDPPASRPVARGRGAAGAGKAAGTSAQPVRRPDGPSLTSFFVESRAELRKVTWPTRQEATNLTVAVIGMTVSIAAFLGLIDAGLDQIVKPLIGG
jgi:preprotein translocase subunit SecE